MTDRQVATGSKVPAFSSETTGGPLSLSDLHGKTLVLYFYPKDSTPGCTTETREFGDASAAFAAANAVVFGISRDSMKSHLKFKEALGIPFELISDPDEALCAMFGVMKMKNMYGKQVRGIERSTFVIDGSGVLVKEWRGVKVPGHVDEVLAAVQAM
jgi:peroxiredoxin Q/BCP